MHILLDKVEPGKDSSYTYYYRERDTVYTGDGKARWYAAKGNTYGYLDANVYPYDTAGIVHTGYRVDSEVKSFTLKRTAHFRWMHLSAKIWKRGNCA